MRIIAGYAKGRRLQLPKTGGRTRPTPARVREALFSMLAAHISNARVLDLFAGSGALGLEALSRGAAQVTFVEHNRTAVRVIQRNCKAVLQGDDTINKTRILGINVLPALTKLRKQKFDIIFIDPPYQANLWTSTLAAIAQRNMATPQTIVVCEHPSRMSAIELPTEPATATATATATTTTTWTCRSTRRFGDVSVSLLELCI